MIVFHAGALGPTASFSNLWSHGGFLPGGILAVLLALQIVMFAYEGVELVGVTAGEAENPAVVLPKATNGIIVRILIFYIGALLVIMSLVPWTELDPNVSPFVFVFGKLGVPGAATIINLVVITAAASSCNSGLFSTGRMLWTLAQRGQGPRAFSGLNRQRVPAAGIHASAAIMLIGVVLNYLVPEARVHHGDQRRAGRHAVDLGHHPGGARQLSAGGAPPAVPRRRRSACPAHRSPTGWCWPSWCW